MSLPALYRQENLCRSFQRMVAERLSAEYSTTYDNRVFYNDTLADPSALDERISALTYWLNLRYVRGGVGMKQPTEYLVDCFHYVGTPASPSDRYGWETTKSGSDLIGALQASSDVGYRIYDYAIVGSPVVTSEFLYVLGNGQPGWPVDRRFIGNDRGLLLEVLTLHVWHMQDLHPGVPAYR